MSKTFKIVGNDISDGYHTFDELYEHRVALFLALCNQNGTRVFYKQDYEEWFCIYLELPCGQISYHVPNKFLPWAKERFTHSPNHEFDGHKSPDVIGRLHDMAGIT